MKFCLAGLLASLLGSNAFAAESSIPLSSQSKNYVEGKKSSLGGGFMNIIEGNMATVGGGAGNWVLSNYATVSGGFKNLAQSRFATISGGGHNTAKGRLSLALGRNAKALGENSAAFGFSGETCTAAGDGEFKICADKLMLPNTMDLNGKTFGRGIVDAMDLTLNDAIDESKKRQEGLATAAQQLDFINDNSQVLNSDAILALQQISILDRQVKFLEKRMSTLRNGRQLEAWELEHRDKLIDKRHLLLQEQEELMAELDQLQKEIQTSINPPSRA